MLNLFLSANRTLFQYVLELLIIDFENERISFRFLTLTKYFLQAKLPFNPVALRIRLTVSGEIEEENLSLNSAETFTALKHRFFTNFLRKNLLSHFDHYLPSYRSNFLL